MRRNSWVLLFVALGCSLVVHSEDNALYDCRQVRTETIACSYRYIDNAELLSASLTLGDLEFTPSQNITFLTTGGTVAILLLVDTSDPARADVIARNIGQIIRLADAANSHQRLGLARFDSNLEMLAPIGSSTADIRSAARGLAAVGKTTELYRSSIEAVRILGNHAAARKALFVLSDGLAEDYAYHHQDVVAEARTARRPDLRFGICPFRCPISGAAIIATAGGGVGRRIHSRRPIWISPYPSRFSLRLFIVSTAAGICVSTSVTRLRRACVALNKRW